MDALALRPVHTQKRVTHVADTRWEHCLWPPARCRFRSYPVARRDFTTPILYMNLDCRELRHRGAKSASLRRLHYRFCETINIYEDMIINETLYKIT